MKKNLSGGHSHFVINESVIHRTLIMSFSVIAMSVMSVATRNGACWHNFFDMEKAYHEIILLLILSSYADLMPDWRIGVGYDRDGGHHGITRKFF